MCAFFTPSIVVFQTEEVGTEQRSRQQMQNTKPEL